MFNKCAHARTQRGTDSTDLAPKTSRDSVRLGVGNVGDKTKRADEALGKNRAVWETVGSYFLTF